MNQVGPSIEAGLAAHYSAVRRRVAYPAKPPIPPVERIWRPKRLIVAANCEQTSHRAKKCNFSKLRKLYEDGLSYMAISHNMGISPRLVRKYIERFGWER